MTQGAMTAYVVATSPIDAEHSASLVLQELRRQGWQVFSRMHDQETLSTGGITSEQVIDWSKIDPKDCTVLVCLLNAGLAPDYIGLLARQFQALGKPVVVLHRSGCYSDGELGVRADYVVTWKDRDELLTQLREPSIGTALNFWGLPSRVG